MMTKEVPMKKTVKIAEIVDYANGFLSAPTNESREAREAIIRMVENCLMKANAWSGYRYLTEQDLPKGIEPGMRPKAVQTSWHTDYEFPDTTRRHYFLRLSLRS
jgi:hypothetical protein